MSSSPRSSAHRCGRPDRVARGQAFAFAVAVLGLPLTAGVIAAGSPGGWAAVAAGSVLAGLVVAVVVVFASTGAPPDELRLYRDVVRAVAVRSVGKAGRRPKAPTVGRKRQR